MSTRATYLFKGRDEYDPDTCIYIHHDGYPEGAVHYIYKAFRHCPGPVHRLTAENFIRANERAEITRSHDAHGDTDYKYTFDGNCLTVEHFGYKSDTWTTVFTGEYWRFIHKYANNEHWPIENYEPIKLVKLHYMGTAPMTETSIKTLLADECKTLGTWACNGNVKGANWNGMVSRIGALKEALTV